MNSTWNQRRWERRTKSVVGQPLKPFRWWQLLGRSVMSISLPVGQADSVVHTVEVKRGGDLHDGVVRARLYLDGELHFESKLPARFPVDGGHIEVRVSQGGMRRCHFIASDGSELQLVPDPKSAEGRRMRFERRHPAAGALVGVLSVIMLIVGLGLNLLQVAEPISQIPPTAEALGTFESPLHLPVWLNLVLGLGAAIGATERAMRMRYHWLLDGGAGT